MRIVTGRSPEQWAGGNVDAGETHVANTVPCTQIVGLVARALVLTIRPPPDPWGVELVGGPTDATALSTAYRRMQENYASILGGREPLIVHHGLGRGSMGWAHVRVGADSPRNCARTCAPPARSTARRNAIEPASNYSITSSVSASNVGGTSSPSALQTRRIKRRQAPGREWR